MYAEGSEERAALGMVKDVAMDLAGEVNSTMGNQAVELTTLSISSPDVGSAKQVVGNRRNTLNRTGVVKRPPKPIRPSAPAPASAPASAPAPAPAPPPPKPLRKPTHPAAAPVGARGNRGTGGAAATEATGGSPADRAAQARHEEWDSMYQEVTPDGEAEAGAGEAATTIVQIYGDAGVSSGDDDADLAYADEDVTAENGWSVVGDEVEVREEDYCDYFSEDDEREDDEREDDRGDVEIGVMYLGIGATTGDVDGDGDGVDGEAAATGGYLITDVAAVDPAGMCLQMAMPMAITITITITMPTAKLIFKSLVSFTAPRVCMLTFAQYEYE